jgi:hypothetical protein
VTPSERWSRTRAGEAASFCELAVQKEPSRVEHYVNLVRIWQAGRHRLKVIQALERGREALPKSAILKALGEEIGMRKPPPLAFLPRESKVNATIGKLLRRRPKT